MTYALVTPARNEADNLPRLAASVLGQTVPPALWVIVDSGSSDGTPELAAELAARHPWIVACASPPVTGASTRADATVHAFELGADVATTRVSPDVVVKLDADLSFAPDYFERVLAAFAVEPELGITSGSCYERDGGGWRQRHVTSGHVWGASRAYRSACLAAVRPLEVDLCWDRVDEVKASLLGWTTRTLVDLPFRHYRREGEREGTRTRAWATTGEMGHYLGYRLLYVVLRALNYARRDVAALAMIAGYSRAALRRRPRYGDPAVRAHVREHQSLRHLPLRIQEAIGRRVD